MRVTTMTATTDWLIEIADDAPETVLAVLADHGWGDGLPVVAPTPERVDAMLAAAGDPDEPLATLQPRRGVVTRRAVAVNAVLAGCAPEVFPVVLSAVRALCRPEVNLRGVNATTHPVAPLVVVHGEIAEHRGVQRRHRRVRTGQPRQRDRRARGAARAPPPRGRTARIGRRGHAGPAVEVHVLRRREPRRVAVGGVRRQSGRRHAERGHGALR